MQPSNAAGQNPASHEGLVPHSTTETVPNARRRRLPEATRAAQMRRWGLHPDRLGDERPRQDAPDGDAPAVRRVYTADADQRALLDGGGWGIAHPGGAHDGGTVAHRGVLHPDEYVDTEDLRARVSERLGFTMDEIRSVYRQGPLSAEGRALRARIDARLLEVAKKGGLMVELGRALGLTVRDDGTCQTITRALTRARS